jgi:nucleotide-binding universal stress UspA family protein
MFNVKEKFSKILVGIDGSKPSMDAVDYAITLAQKVNAELTALYVESTPVRDDYTSDTPEDQIPDTVKHIVHNAKKESEPWFAEIAEKVRASAAAATVKENTEETVGRVIQLKTIVIISPLSVIGNITEYAEHENIDLLIVGTRGRSGFKRLLLGSIASGVVTHAHCPVMVVK